MSILNFIVDNLLCEEAHLTEELTEQFVMLIDNFCGIDKSSNRLILQEEENDDLNLEQLFKICQINKENEKKAKISKKLLPVLLLRCKEIIEGFLHDEKLYGGGISIPR